MSNEYWENKMSNLIRKVTWSIIKECLSHTLSERMEKWSEYSPSMKLDFFLALFMNGYKWDLETGWQKNGFLHGSAKTELKIPCEDFYTLFMLNHHSQAHLTPTPPFPNTYSYLPFENSKFMVVRECSKEYQSQICNFISKNRLITYC